MLLVEDVAQAETLDVPDPRNLAYATQTTLSVDDTAAIVAALRRRFPAIQGPKKEDICYATTNRQAAVKAIAARCDALVVIGAPNSSNSMRLVEVAANYGCAKSRLVQRAADMDWDWLGERRAARHHRRRLGAGAAGRGADRRLPRALRRHRRGSAHDRGKRGLQAAAPAGGLMAVYTEVSDEELEAFLADYDIGEAVSFKGIAEGVENTNYVLTTTRGQYMLTLYEKRVDPRDLPFFLGLMDHLAERGINCPRPIHGRDGKALRTLAGKPAAITSFLHGMWPRRIDACSIAARSARRWPALHLAGRDFALKRPNALSVAGWRPVFDGSRRHIDGSLARELAAELDFFEANWPQRSAGRRDPCRPVQRQRLLPARPAVGDHRLLFRLQRLPSPTTWRSA